jgi:hypothetical protein
VLAGLVPLVLFRWRIGVLSYGSAKILTSEMQAPASAPTTTPPSTSTRVRSWPRKAAAMT